MSALGLLWLCAGVPALGHGLLRLARVHAGGVALHGGLSIALGLSAALLLLYAPLAVAGRVEFWPAHAACAAALAAAAAELARRRRELAQLPWRSALPWALALAAIVYVARAEAFASYDERAIYGLKAKALLAERGVGGAVFQDPEAVHFHRDYPLGLPLAMAWTGSTVAATGGEAAAASPGAAWAARTGAIESYAVFACLWALGILLIGWGLLRRATEDPLARALFLPLAVPVTLVHPWLGGGSWSWAGADIPLALLVGGAAALFALPEPARPWRARALFALLLATTLCLKQDGWISIAAAGCALALARKPALCALLAGLALAVSVPIRRVRSGIPGADFEDGYLDGLLARPAGVYLERLPQLFRHSVETLSEQSLLAFAAGALALGLAWGWRRGGSPRTLAVWVAAHSALTLLAFLLTPHNLDWHVSTALPRVASHAALPAGILLSSAAAHFLGPTLAALRSSRAASARSAAPR